MGESFDIARQGTGVSHFRRELRAAVGRPEFLVDDGPPAARQCWIVNLSHHGILVEGLDAPVGTELTFRLEGPVACIGLGHVVHREGTVAGLAVDHWYSGEREVHAVVLAARLAESAWPGPHDDEVAAGRVETVTLPPMQLQRYAALLDDREWQELEDAVDRLRAMLDGRTVWNVNTTAHGGGVAEMLRSTVAYVRGAGIDWRWTAITGGAEFFAVTKRIHNRLHGSPGDGMDLDAEARNAYEAHLPGHVGRLRDMVRPGDVVILHDPQTAGLAPALQALGARVLWRVHIGADEPDDLMRSAWAFLLPYVEEVEAYVFSREEHVWSCLDAERVRIIQPSIDAFSPKNQDLEAPVVDSILRAAGLLPGVSTVAPDFLRHDGVPGRVARTVDVLGGRSIEPGLPLVCQVSRWDRLKDPIGVIEGFVGHVLSGHEAQLVLAGPATSAVADDPEGADALREVWTVWNDLPQPARDRVLIACLPMEDGEENAAIVNALQRRTDVIVQKSLAEGFGLTVSEAMWKGRPVVASATGGIQDQIEAGRSGILVSDPADVAAFGTAVSGLLADPHAAARIGAAGRERARTNALLTREIGLWTEAISAVLAREL